MRNDRRFRNALKLSGLPHLDPGGRRELAAERSGLLAEELLAPGLAVEEVSSTGRG